MTGYDSPGEVLTLTAPVGGVTKDQGVKIGSVIVIPTVSVDAGEKFAGIRVGVVQHAKVSAQSWTEGVKIYLDDDASPDPLMTTTSSGNTLVGVAAKAAANPSSTGFVLLDGAVR